MKKLLPPVGTSQSFRQKWLLFVLVLLLFGIALVYGRIILERRHTAAAGLPPKVSTIVAKMQGSRLAFPRLHPLSNVVWDKMSAAQRRVLSQRRRLRYEAFFLAFAHATPEQQRAVVDRTRLRFEMRSLAFARATKLRRQAVVEQIQALFPAPFRNGGNDLQRTMALGLAGGNPEIHAAMAQFFMALRNGR